MRELVKVCDLAASVSSWWQSGISDSRPNKLGLTAWKETISSDSAVLILQHFLKKSIETTNLNQDLYTTHPNARPLSVLLNADDTKRWSVMSRLTLCIQ